MKKIYIFILVFISSIIVLITCNNEENSTSSQWVNHGEPFWLYFNNFPIAELGNVKIKINDTLYVPTLEKKLGRYCFKINEKIPKSDTLYLYLKSKTYKIYDIQSIKEKAYTQTHRKIKIWRVTSAIIDGHKITNNKSNYLLLEYDSLK